MQPIKEITLRFKTLAGAAISAAALAVTALPAAAAEVSVNPTNVSVDGQIVNVAWSGFTQPVFAQQCFRSITVADFTPSTDCDYDANGGIVLGPLSGTAQFPVFKGDRFLLQAACGVSEAELPVSNPCYIRLTQGSNENINDDIEVAITFSNEPTPVIPEVPYSVLLPMGAMAAIGAGIFLNRRRVAA